MDGFFVPQNPSEAAGLTHPRKPRSFPVVHVDPDGPTVFFHWPEADATPETRQALVSLLAKLPRLGHSSSFCTARCVETAPTDGEWACYEFTSPESDTDADVTLRVPYAGLIQAAERAFDAEGRQAERDALISTARKSAKPTKSLKPAATSRGRHDPVHRWQGYAKAHATPACDSPWDARILVLRQTDGARQGLQSTLQITEVLHRAILSRWGKRASEFGPTPPWISGHAPNACADTPSRPLGDGNHLAFFPLPFVNAPYADGHLLGLALALPRIERTGVTPQEFRQQWKHAQHALFGSGSLKLHPADGSWEMVLEPAPADLGTGKKSVQALHTSRWTRPSFTWQSVTPIVLDRHPKPHFGKNPELWAESCRSIIRQSCERIGLPAPMRVEPSFHSPLNGVPPSMAFAPQSEKGGRNKRFHIHARVEFASHVRGPLLIGAGRFRGYGLMLPVDSSAAPSSPPTS
jgi:CRISPR-associated protein Csb2